MQPLFMNITGFKDFLAQNIEMPDYPVYANHTGLLLTLNIQYLFKQINSGHAV